MVGVAVGGAIGYTLNASGPLRDGAWLKLARAEEPPFRDGWFERIVYWLVIHLLDRPAAFAAAHRLLGPGGRACVVTFDAAHFDDYWAKHKVGRVA